MEPLTFKQQDELLDFMAKNNSKEFNFLKAIEEANEFIDALVKYQTKHPDNPKKPTPQDILDEYADFMYRGAVALKVLFPELTDDQFEEKINDRVDSKLLKLFNYKADGKYEGGL